MMKKLALIMAVVAVSCAPAMATIFSFTISGLVNSFDGVSAFSTTVDKTLSLGVVHRTIAPTSSTLLLPTMWGGGSADFSLSMTISAIGATTATGTGSFILTDVDGDTISGTMTGTWTKASSPTYVGTLAGVVYTPSVGGETTFDGDSGAPTLMTFVSPPPYNGAIVELTANTGSWFTSAFSNTVPGGSIDATVIPAPAAVVLGMMGFGLVGWVKRRMA